jgi:hypothetical protein
LRPSAVLDFEPPLVADHYVVWREAARIHSLS